MKEKALKLLKEPSFIDKLVAIPFYLNLLKKFNTLQGDYDTLVAKTKDRLFEDYFKKTSVPEELIEENTELRIKVKELKEIIKENK